MALDAYANDFEKYSSGEKGFPMHEHLRNLLAEDSKDATRQLRKAAMAGEGGPLYVLVWENMVNFGKAVKQYPEIKDRIRLITLGTGLKYGP